MLYYLAETFVRLLAIKSITLRSAVAFLISFVVVLQVGKPFIAYLKSKKVGEGIREEGPASHFSKKGTPTMGGVLIVFSLVLTTLITADLKNKFIQVILLCLFLFSLIGFIDDFKKFTKSKKGLSGKKKILGQIIISFIAWGFVVRYRLTGTHIDFSIVNPFRPDSYFYIGAALSLVFIMLVLIGTSNAVNITDGLDGLVIMPVIIASTVLAAIAYFTGHIELSEYLHLYYVPGAGEITVFLCALIGAGLGFLWYNFYPAQIFMGDTGSLTLGGILGLVAIFLKQEILLVIIGFVFVVEAISVILQVGSYKLRKKRIFRMAPIHHHFELEGLPETKVTMRFWILSLICGIVGFVIVKLK